MRRDKAQSEKMLSRDDIYARRGWKVPLAFRAMSYVTWIPLFLIAIFLFTFSLFVPILMVKWALSVYDGLSFLWLVDILFLSAMLGASYFVFGIGLMFIGGLLKRVLDPIFGLKEGDYPFLSPVSGYWSIVNGVIIFNRQFFLELTRTSFLLVLFYRLLGMTIGKGTMINSSYLYDPDFVELGRGVTIGGDAMILGHVGEKGILKLQRTVVGDRVDIGQSALIMPGVDIGEGAVVGAHSLVTKGTKIPAYEVWAGVPARKIAKLQPPTGR